MRNDKTKLKRNPFNGDFRKKLKNVKAFESFAGSERDSVVVDEREIEDPSKEADKLDKIAVEWTDSERETLKKYAEEVFDSTAVYNEDTLVKTKVGYRFLTPGRLTKFSKKATLEQAIQEIGWECDDEDMTESTEMYRGDFGAAKKFYSEVILPACGGCDPGAVVDALVNDDASDDEDMTQYLRDEFGIDLDAAKKIVRGRGMFMDQLFDPADLNEKESIRAREEGRVPNQGKAKVADNVKEKLKELRAMSDAELMRFLTAGMTPNALKRFMK
jgi:hypothetical protein